MYTGLFLKTICNLYLLLLLCVYDVYGGEGITSLMWGSTLWSQCAPSTSAWVLRIKQRSSLYSQAPLRAESSTPAIQSLFKPSNPLVVFPQV